MAVSLTSDLILIWLNFRVFFVFPTKIAKKVVSGILGEGKGLRMEPGVLEVKYVFCKYRISPRARPKAKKKVAQKVP